MELRNVMSLFDGGSMGQAALRKRNIKFEKYYASEINRKSIKVALKNFPDMIHIGDVREVDGESYENIDLLIGGSPCTDLSINGKQNGMVTKCDIKVTSLKQYLELKQNGFEFQGESFLFWEYVRVLHEVKPKYFLLENVVMKGKNKFWEKVMSDALGVQPIRINSSDITAQNRDRLYWTNIPNVSQPEKKDINVWDVIPGAVAGSGIRGVKKKGEDHYTLNYTKRKDGKFNCITTSRTTSMVDLGDHHRELTPTELEIIQTLDKGYTDVKGLTDGDRVKVIGNGWTVKVIEHIFEPLTK